MRIRRSFHRRALAAVLSLSLTAVAGAQWSTAAAAETSKPSGASTPAARARHTLPFISDDYARALAEAKQRQVPIFVESWAPW